MPLLGPGDVFPHLPLRLPGGSTADLPDVLSTHFGVVLFYRGSWCPYCNAQLRAFQRAQEAFSDAGIRVVALSTDDEATTQKLVDKHHLEFLVGHSADIGATVAATGAFSNERPAHLQSTGFLLDPAGRVLVSVYSSGAIGRLLPEDVLGMVSYLQAHATT